MHISVVMIRFEGMREGLRKGEYVGNLEPMDLLKKCLLEEFMTF